MYKPSRNSVKEYTDTVSQFRGLNEKARADESEFSDMINMSSEHFPLMASRNCRAKLLESKNKITAITNKEAFIHCEVLGAYNRFYINGKEITALRSTNTKDERKIVGMGAYEVIFPDKKYVNTLDYTDCGSLENVRSSGELGYDGTETQRVILTPCTIEGKNINATTVSKTAPEKPENGEVWADTSGEKTVIKKWDSGTSQWVAMSTTYIKITRNNTSIGNGFKKWDAVSVSGIENPKILKNQNYDTDADDRVKKQVEALNTDGLIVYDVAPGYIVVAGILDSQCYITSGEVKVKRKVPDMDFVVECNNRLWGCKYGEVNGKIVNEIYCCRQGDFKNWYAYLGVSTDSYAVTVGSEGSFTGAAVFNKCPVFFKQNYIHQIYGSSPSSFQMVTTNCEGVEKGQGDSVCVADNVLYYKGPTGFFAFSGTLPQKISRNLKNVRFTKVIGEGVGDKVYWACGETDGSKMIYVYDTYNGVWHKEDILPVKAFSRDGHILYMLTEENGISTVWSVTGETDTSFKLGDETFPQLEQQVPWGAESVDIGYGDSNMKYISSLTIRAILSEGAKMAVSVSCDGEDFVTMGEIFGEEGVHTRALSFSPGRCERFRYRIEGVGDVKIISVKKKFIQGSDRP